MKGRVIAAALVASLACASAEARAPSIWVQCDGQAKPEGAATSAARLATVALLGGFGIGLLALPETATGAPAAGGADGVAACTAALADPVLAPFWERKVNILRARARHYVEIDKPEEALKDLEAAVETGRSRTSSILFDRSVGVSVQLFEAMLRARAGEHEKADALAIAAADARPYSLKVQELARQILSTAPALGADERRILDRQRRLNPYTSTLMAYRLDVTDERDAAADAWEAVIAERKAAAAATAAAADDDAEDDATPTPAPRRFSSLMLARATTAMLRAGRLERARALNAEFEAALAEPAPAAPPADPRARTQAQLTIASVERLLQAIEEADRKSAETFKPLIAALMKEREGDVAGAVALVQAKFADFPASMASAELMQRLNADPARAADVPAFVVQATLAKARPPRTERALQLNLKTAVRTLPAFDRVDGPFRYRVQTTPSATGRGFMVEPVKDQPNTLRVRYTGAPSTYAQEELLLLRAAQAVRNTGAEAFYLKSRSTTSITVVTTTAAAEPARSNRVAEVIAALKPVYIDIPAAMDAERRR